MTPVTEFILNRTSEPRLVAPAPSDDVLERAFACAARAPDHALLRPWRYLVIEGEERVRLGELFAACCPEQASDQDLEKARRAPLRAPMVIVAIVSPKAHPKVPEVEQVMSAAAGVGFLELALQEAGFGVMWRTGPMAYNPAVRNALGVEAHEHIAGFIYTGTVAMAKPSVPRPPVAEFVRRWPEV
ncbi:nitroreductase family protein [Marinobacter lutaoensis]|jgi:nitroreductase|uniref:nitroreductase family protein n=1 Tax=Marinobacter lutaoensis TaxID=135739 RepID=UPI001593E78D|nr:nitroreductase family protein [Marinobacter lutaoensis]NVD35079.1 nitroreductase family protein [Marinobacter lutaoensis]